MAPPRSRTTDPSVFVLLALVTLNARGSWARERPAPVPPRIIEDPVNVTVMRNEPATLRCAFEGEPKPEVTWYREGEVLEPRGHRLILPEGALFFLRVTQGRASSGASGGGGGGRGDAGTYWCVARNAAGQARSRNATLTVAYLQPDFRRLPESSRSVVGESVRFHCQPPRGQPEPEVTWRKNGVPIAWDDELALDKERIHVEESGDLIIRHVLASDAGKYQCVAANMAATRETPAVSLAVYVRPQVTIGQPDLVVVLGEPASFECQASGDPSPRVVWRRLIDERAGAALPATNGDHRSTFKIERVELAHAGRYVCQVSNDVGEASAVAVLTVLVPPQWNAHPPSEIRAEAGQQLSVDCSVSGTPEPLIFWRREAGPASESRQDVESSPSSSSSRADQRWHVTSNGTLTIRDVRPDDAGPLYCAAVNAGGALLARVHLEVTVPTHRVPVYFQIGPANQTLPIRSPALLQCQVEHPDAAGQPEEPAEIRWTRNGQPLNQTGVKMLATGSLSIDHLQPEDSGTYTCWAGSDKAPAGASWTASLVVENPINPNVVFNRAPSDLMALPGSPSQPVVTNQTAHSVTITWQSNSRMGASPLIGYTVELFSPTDGGLSLPGAWTWGQEHDVAQQQQQHHGHHSLPTDSWVVAARRLRSNSFTIEGLKAGTWLLALVRAENSHGLSLPSPVSRWIHSNGHSSDPDVVQTRELLSGSILQLDRVQALSSTAVELHWDIADGESYIEGLHLFYYETASPAMPDRASHVIKDPGSMAFVLPDLRPDTNYTVFVIPFYGSIEGRPSNSRTVRTHPDAPSGYPQNVTARQFNESSALVQWQPPPADQRNGIISAYQIFVYSDETNMLLANLTLPATSTSIAVGGLEGGTRYAFKAAAWTQVGLGPSSPPVVLTIEVHHSTATVPMTDPEVGSSFPSAVAPEMWMILLVGGTLLVLLLTVILVVIVRRRKACQDGAGGSRSRASSRGNQSNHLLWPLPAQPWSNGTTSDPSKDVHPQLGPDYAEVFHHANPSMSSFSTQPTPAYASTTLIRNAASSSLPYRYQPAVGRSVPQLLDAAAQQGLGGRNSSQPLVPNWLELLPPPPQHPPPPLIVSPAERSGSSGKSDGYPPYLTATLPSTIHAANAGPPVAYNQTGQGYPFRSSFNNAQSQPTLLAQQQQTRHSYSSQQRGSGRYQSDDNTSQEGLYATCTYDQIDPYPLSSYR